MKTITIPELIAQNNSPEEFNSIVTYTDFEGKLVTLEFRKIGPDEYLEREPNKSWGLSGILDLEYILLGWFANIVGRECSKAAQKKHYDRVLIEIK